jgi:predicted hotdog family 3-hydroxylacyl-ACP dehydratase
MELTLPIQAEKLIPHRLPMRLIDRLLEVDGKSGVAEALVVAECPLVADNGQLEDVALIELMAQAYAALKGYCDLRDAAPIKQGFLVGIRNAVPLISAHAGDRLKIHINTLFELESFAVAAGEVWRNHELLASGEIKIWVQ